MGASVEGLSLPIPAPRPPDSLTDLLPGPIQLPQALCSNQSRTFPSYLDAQQEPAA